MNYIKNCSYRETKLYFDMNKKVFYSGQFLPCSGKFRFFKKFFVVVLSNFPCLPTYFGLKHV